MSQWRTKISFMCGRRANVERRKSEANIYKRDEFQLNTFNRFSDAHRATYKEILREIYKKN